MSGAMKFNFNTIYVGLTGGLVLPTLLMYIYWQVNYDYMDLNKFFAFTSRGEIHIKLISLFTAPNLGLFFLFIWKNYNLAARGVLGSTFLYALLVLIVKLAE